MILPSYLVIGAAKCGTTSVCSALGNHPGVFMSDPKEIHYFGRDDAHKTLEWYAAHFEHAGGRAAVGEGSTSYTHPRIIARCAREIRSTIPDARLIYMVRNPLKRLESDWRMRKHEEWAAGSISESVRAQETLTSHGLYWQNLNVYRSIFPDEQLLIVFLEDFARDQAAELQRCYSHIGVEAPPTAHAASTRLNRSSGFRRDGAIARYLRGTRIFSAARNLAPDLAVTVGKALLTSADVHEVKWDPILKKEVIARFAEESAPFLEFCGKPADYWKYPAELEIRTG